MYKPPSQNLHILIVDDEPINILIINKILLNSFKNKPHIISASHGLDAVKQAYNHYFHIIFMDIMMPHLDGLQAANQIRVFNTLSPIIFITALSDILSIKLPKNSSIIQKPISHTDIHKILSQYPSTSSLLNNPPV